MRVLISGAGIAGTTLAYWLAERGLEPTVVERGGQLRSSGNPVDVEGMAIAVAERMGVMSALRAAATGSTGITFVDGAGRRIGRINLQAIRRAAASRSVELGRADLAAVLYERARENATFRFDDSIAALHEDDAGVDVVFESGAEERFDVVVGADGLHSGVRRLAFGPESQFVTQLGLHVASIALDGTLAPGRDVTMYNAPGRLATISPTHRGAVAFFAFRSGALTDPRDTAQHRRLLLDVFAHDGWRVPELLDRLQRTDDLYFDAVSQVTLDRWSTHRITLVGDAASSVSLFGGGSSLAMIAAFRLADQLAADPTNPTAALDRYEAEHRRDVEPRQRNVKLASTLLVPATRGGILLRNLAANLWPVAAAGAWGARRLRITPASGRVPAAG